MVSIQQWVIAILRTFTFFHLVEGVPALEQVLRHCQGTIHEVCDLETVHLTDLKSPPAFMKWAQSHCADGGIVKVKWCEWPGVGTWLLE